MLLSIAFDSPPPVPNNWRWGEQSVIPCGVDVVLSVLQKELLQFANAAGLGERHTLSITPAHFITHKAYRRPGPLGHWTDHFFPEPIFFLCI